jgi:ATPases involved in chromosome partitioning
MAISLAIKGKKVLVIDGDLRYASTSSFVNSPKQGLSDYLGKQIDNIYDTIIVDEKYTNLSILPVGTIPPNPTELLFDERLETLINDMRSKYDYIFIDCPPIDIVADTQIIERLADRTLFVVRAGLLERSMLSDLNNIYREERFKNMALILNGTTSSIGYHKYGYRYGYQYGYYGFNSQTKKRGK